MTAPGHSWMSDRGRTGAQELLAFPLSIWRWDRDCPWGFFHPDALNKETVAAYLLEFKTMCDPSWVSHCTTLRRCILILNSIFTKAVAQDQAVWQLAPYCGGFPCRVKVYSPWRDTGRLWKIWGSGDMMRVLILGVILATCRGWKGGRLHWGQGNQFNASSR